MWSRSCCKQSPSYYRDLKWPTVFVATNAKYTSHRQDQAYSSSSREVPKRCLLQATLEECTAYCKQVLERVEQGIFTKPAKKRQKWTRQRRNYTEGDIVLLKDDNTCRNKWPMAKVIATRRDDQGQVRSVTVQSATRSMLSRPVNKLVLLLESPQDRPGIPDEEPEDHFWIRNMMWEIPR